MTKISDATIAKIGRGEWSLGLASWSWEVLNYSVAKEVQTKGGQWRFYLRQNYSPPELVERGIKPADSVGAFYRSTEKSREKFSYWFMSSPGTPPNLEEAVQNANVLTQGLLERGSWLGKTWPFIVAAGAVAPVVGLEAVNYFLGSPIKLDARVGAGISVFVLGGIGTLVGLYKLVAVTRHRLIARVAAQMSNPGNYVYGEEGGRLLEAESRKFTNAWAEEEVYKSAGVQVPRLVFHKQLEGLIKSLTARS